MSSRDSYQPGKASGAKVLKNGEDWTLVLVRELRHPPQKVWHALTDPASVREWAPFDADRPLDTVGPVRLSTVGAPTAPGADTRVMRADPPHLLEYRWGDRDLRWQLEASGEGTRLTLWHHIDRSFVSMGAAGWHICLDVLERLVGGDPLGRIVGPEAMSFGWPRLNAEYAAQFGVAPPVWPPNT
jgi:uncharacterized protein YndB with AHSA1/START domain